MLVLIFIQWSAQATGRRNLKFSANTPLITYRRATNVFFLVKLFTADNSAIYTGLYGTARYNKHNTR